MGATGDFLKNSIVYEHILYATLDCTPPQQAKLNKKASDFLEIPHGWRLAEPTPDIIKVVTENRWGTQVVVFADGNGYFTAGVTNMQGNHYQANLLRREGSKVKPSQCYLRVMIVSTEPAPCRLDGDVDHCYHAIDRMWEDKEFTDCEVVSQGNVFKCHRAVLAQASPVFKRMFSGEMVEAKRQRVQLETVEPEAASSFLAYLYKGAIDVNQEHFSTVLKLMDFYQVECATAKLCKHMVDKLNKDNIVPIVTFMKRVRDRPHIAPHWSALTAKVRASEELTELMMTQ